MNIVGAVGFIERARSMRPSVNISAANLSTVWPSTPVCSKFIPADPSAQMMSCNCKRRCELYLGDSREIGTYLIIPTVGASPDLDAICQAVSTAQKIGTEFGDTIGSGVIQAYNE